MIVFDIGKSERHTRLSRPCGTKGIPARHAAMLIDDMRRGNGIMGGSEGEYQSIGATINTHLRGGQVS